MKNALFMIVLLSVVFSQKISAQEDVTVFFRNGSKLIGTLTKTDENGRMQVKTPCGTVVNFTDKSVEEIIYDDDTPMVKRSFRKVATIYLRNGSILKGRLTELDDGNRFRIETSNGSNIYFSEKSVREMEVEEVETPVSVTRQRRYSNETIYEEKPDRKTQSQYKTNGYKGFVELGYSIGVGDFGEGRVELSTTHGYQFNPYLFLGGGLAWHYFHESSVSVMPFFVDFRASFTDKPITPFAGIKLGYAFGISSDDTFDVGTYLAPSVGVKFKLGYSLALNLSGGYSFQFVETYWGTEHIGGITLKLGIEF